VLTKLLYTGLGWYFDELLFSGIARIWIWGHLRGEVWRGVFTPTEKRVWGGQILLP